jgi:hypothetical protein
MDEKTIQTLLFKRIEAKVGTHKNMAKEVATILGIGSNVIYDRLSGKKSLSIEEMYKLALHYRLSLDDLIHPDATGFRLRSQLGQPRSFEEYLSAIATDISLLNRLLPNCRLHYAASDLTFFYYLLEENLILFKLYIWGRTVWDIEQYQQQRFSFISLRQPRLMQQLEQISTAYDAFPTTEYWHTNMLDTTLNQIRYCLMCNLFAQPSDALVILKSLYGLLNKMEEMARTERKGGKNGKGESKIYFNEMMQNPAIILVDSPEFKAVYSVYDSPNFMISYTTNTINNTTFYLKRIEKHSFRLSEEQHCNRFFEAMRDKIHNAELEFTDHVERLQAGRKWGKNG